MKEFTLNIKSPCHEDWSSMQISNKGKFCQNCSKEVIDLTHLSDCDIGQLLKKEGKSICGRLRESQQGRIVKNKTEKSWLSIKKIAASILLMSFTKVAYSLSKPLLQQKEREVILPTNTNVDQENEIPILSSDSILNTIKGKVVDFKTKEPIPFANIILKGTSLGVSTDFDGEFKLDIPDSLIMGELILQISYIGYKTAHTIVEKGDLNANIELFVLKHDELIVMGRICVEKKKWYQFWKLR